MKDVNERIGETIMKMTPNDINSIVNELNIKPKKRWFEIFRPALAFGLVLMLSLGAFGINSYNNGKIASTISLDVNPSIEINVNTNDKVISVNATNEDARTVIGDMDFKGSSLEVTINALIGSLLRNGYLTDAANSILVSVEGKDAGKSKELEEEIVEEINEILSGSNIQGAVLYQVLDSDDVIEDLAEEYGISEGKATLIYDIVNTENSTHTFEELIPLTINELNLIASSSKVTLNNIESQGTASQQSYIGQDAAKTNALEKVGLTAAEITEYEYELDYEHGVMVYEIEFKANGLEYDVKVNANDGSIVHSHSEVDDDYVGNETVQEKTTETKTQTSTNYTEEQVKDIALNQAGVNEYREYEIEIDDGKYEVSFKSEGKEYEYEINPGTGEIEKTDVEVDNDYYEDQEEDDWDDDWDDDDDD